MKSLPALLIVMVACGTRSASADLYAMDFESDDSANWRLNNSSGDAQADYFFDYATVGIPPAPSGTGTRGMKLQANLFSGVFSGMSTSPLGLHLPPRYLLTFDWWANSIGPFPGGGSGSTNLSTFGVGTSGTVVQWPGGTPTGTQQSVWFAATGDGNSFSDWRAYSSAAPVSYGSGEADPNGELQVYAALSRNSAAPYYSGFGQIAPPAAQAAFFPSTQTGMVDVGAAGFQWHSAAILMDSSTITWIVDRLVIATIDRSTVSLGGDNVFFGHADVNAGISLNLDAPDLLFTLIDNIRIVRVPGFAITNIQRLASTNEIQLTWNSLPQRVYDIEFSEDFVLWEPGFTGAQSTGLSTTVLLGPLGFPDLHMRVRAR